MQLVCFRRQLLEVPLYIIVADQFSESAAFVGSAILSLDSVMSDVYDSLMSDGISVPASSGVRSSLRVFNLMGHNIGESPLATGCFLAIVCCGWL